MAINNNNRYVTADYTYNANKKNTTTTPTTTRTSTKKSSTGAATPAETTTQKAPVVYYSGGGGEESYVPEYDPYDRIAAAYDRAAGLLKGNYDSAVGRLNAAKKKSTKETKQDAEKALRDAYISNMLGKRDLNQRLSAMGYNGGATETTMARLANQYGNARNDIVTQRARDISNINQTYGDNLAAALQAYNSALANLEMSRLQMELSLH